MSDMNNVQPTRQRVGQASDPMVYVARRLFSLPVVVGAFVAFVGAGLLESAGLPGPAAMAGGLTGLVATALAADLVVDRVLRHRVKRPQ